MFSYKDILKIVYPLIISGFGQSIVYVTDTFYLGRISDVALAASAIAGLFYASLSMIGFGISSGMQILIAQSFGEGNLDETKKTTIQGQVLQLSACFIFMMLYYSFNEQFVSLLISNTAVKTATLTFLDARMLGLLPMYLFYGFRSYFLGIGRTVVISISTIIMAVANFILNYFFIYGSGFVKPLGMVGAAYASSVSEGISFAIILIFYIIVCKNDKSFFIQIDKFHIKRILNISYPLIIQHFISVFSWFMFFVFVEKIGQKALAISNVIRSVYVLLMAPLLAFSHSTVTIVGQIFGAKHFQNITQAVYRVIFLSALFTLPFSLWAFLFPESLLSIFTNQNDIIMEGVPVLKIVSFALMCFATTIPLLSALAGIGQTLKTLYIEIATLIFYTLANIFFVFVWKLQLSLVWCNEFVYFICIGGMSFFFLRKILNKYTYSNKSITV